MFRTYLHVLATRTRRTNGRNLGTFQESSGPSEIGEHWIERYFDLVTLLVSKGRFVICLGLRYTLREDQ